ncbi:MAG: hypothetical protein UU02_C0041G0004 [Candidatus Woesebacteria bacterium GW2011_GWA1_40_43]|uniref:Uncharacterized protein n=1 Tax=Candidatus Woesebacteria bacterium GW2011_GWA1_40_43 TaxID=1618553 RepID=A0A0G0SCV2_9BACT|nr:MAG: hypothetical protein UU02_C0041G0004 [Candidatus Woesebacteria bacterium GW2011_GWA1_40_43]
MEEGSTGTQTEAKKKGSKWLFKSIPYIIILAIGIYGGTYLVRQKPTWFGLPQGTAQAQAEANALVAKVSKLMTLPTVNFNQAAASPEVSAIATPTAKPTVAPTASPVASPVSTPTQ